MKKQLLIQISNSLENKLNQLQKDIEDLRLELSDNTKSTAGDKHETSRAMTHLEMEKLGKQHIENQKMHALVIRLLSLDSTKSIQMGSLVKTDKFNFLLGLPLGKFVFNDEDFLCISIQSPVGQLLLNRKINESIQLPSGNVIILQIQ